MLTAPSYQRQWLLVFGVTLATFVGAAVWLASRLPSFRDPSFDFYSMKRDEIFSVYGLTRRQEGSVKLGFAETYPAPEIGLYGNHIVGAFGADAFGRPQDAKFFFNYFYANLSLPEILSYLLQLEQRGHLPKQLILVQITPPNADNGQFIINLGNELPPDLLLRDIERDGRTKYLLKLGKAVWQTTNNRLHEILNYNTAILSIVQRGDYQDRVVSPTRCGKESSGSARYLPGRLQNALAMWRGDFCAPGLWGGAFRRDGSHGSVLEETANTGDQPTIVPNENPLNASDRALRAGDEREIASRMRAIDAIGARHGINVAFLVPPVFETDRRDSVVNQIFDHALSLVPNIAVIDHRHMHSNPAYFNTPIHPSRQYYRIVAEEILRRHLIE